MNECRLSKVEDSFSYKENKHISWINIDGLRKHDVELISARTETKMFFEHVWNKADALLFLKGRPHFYTVEGKKARANSGAPVVLIAYGQNNKIFLKQCSIEGQFIDLTKKEAV